ncbi:MAG: DMT family transporter [Alphaproteobacteria bacterium]|nr:DMT family transporter [Alphaproteobacteria bacterium]
MTLATQTEADAPAVRPPSLPVIGKLATSIRALPSTIRGLPGNLRGALWLVLSTTVFTLIGVFIRKATQGLDSIEVSFFRSCIGLVFVAPALLRARINPLRTTRLGWHVVRAVFGTSAMTLGFYAAARLPLADSTSISFSQPLFIIVLAALVMRETVGWRRWAATVVGFIGVLVMMRPGADTIHVATFVALAGSLCGACSVMVVKKLTADEKPMAVVGSIAILSTVFLLGPAIMVWRWPTPIEWVYVTAIGFCATIGQYCWVRAYAVAEASALAPFDYVRLPLAVLLGVWVFGEHPSIWTAVGALLIASSTLYSARREARRVKRVTA